VTQSALFRVMKSTLFAWPKVHFFAL